MLFSNESLNNSIWGGNTFLICAYILCFYLLIKERQRYPRAFMFLVPVQTVCLLLTYNPFFIGIFNSRVAGIGYQNAVVGRMSYLLMTEITVTCGSLLLLTSLKTRVARRYYILIALIVVISLVHQDGYRPFRLEYNHYYKISKGAKNIVDSIRNDDEGLTTVLLIGNKEYIDSLKEESPDTYYIYNDVLMLTQQYKANTEVTQANDYSEMTDNTQYDYILCYPQTANYDKISEDGYHKIWTDGIGVLYERE